jgi:hypothetical protein
MDVQRVKTDSTYLALHRQIIESDVFTDANLLRLWIWILCRASFKRRYVALKTGKGERTVELRPGELIVGRSKSADDLGWSPSTFRDRLSRLASMGMISIKPDNQWSVVSVAKWNEFQSVNTTKTTAKAKTAYDSQKNVDSPVDYKATQAHTTKQDDNRTTTERQPNDTYNKGKNDKNGENASKSSSSSMDLSFAHFSLDAKRLFDLLSPSERSEFREDVCEFACAAHRMGEGSKLVGEWIKNAKRQAKAGQMFDYLKGCVRHSANDRGLRWTELTKDCPSSPSDWPGVATVSLRIDRERMRIGIYKSNPAKWSQASDAEMEQEINRRIEAAS